MLTRLLEGSWLKLMYGLLAFALAEEAVFRWFSIVKLQGVLPETNAILTAIILCSSVIFALLHLKNFEEECGPPPHWLFVFPHFLSGLFFAYAFLHWGFAAAVAIHWAHNFSLFSAEKIIHSIDPKKSPSQNGTAHSYSWE